MKPVWMVLGIAAGAGVLLFWLRPAPSTPPVPAQARPDETVGVSLTHPTPARSNLASRGSNAVRGLPASQAVDLPEATPGTAPTSVRADQVLATVNGTVVGLKDLVPLEAHEVERAMTAEEFQSRLERAIELELTTQAAAARGLSLTPEQQARVEDLGRKREETRQQYLQQGMTWNSGTPAQLEFEKRVTRALLLQENLVKKDHAVAPSPDPAQQARYEQRRRELLADLRARAQLQVASPDR